MSEDTNRTKDTAPSDDRTNSHGSQLNPPPRRRPSPPGEIAAAGAAPGAPAESARDKQKPTGDYMVGYARPPIEHQFSGKPGPGRPKGSLSHDTIVRRNLAQTRKVKIDGKVKTMPMREYLVMTQIKLAAEGKLAALKEILAESARLYPPLQVAQAGNATTELSAAEQAGRAARAKGMALFPRKIAGRYAMIGRQDHENIWLLTSGDLYHWEGGAKIVTPRWPWEFIQMGNCGSPVEIDEGWLVITHGVGAVRNYCIGACLLDKDDPSKVLARVTFQSGGNEVHRR